MTARVLDWSDQLATGLAEVDSQHRRLIDIINMLGKLHAHGATADELLAVLHELRSYTLYHFQTEADLMQAWPVDAANRAAHLKAHRGFVERVEKVGELFRSGTVADVVDHLLAFLVKWLVHHISGVDARMAREIHALRAGTPAEVPQSAENKLRDALVDTVSELYDSIGARTFEMLELNHRLEAELERRTQAERREQHHNRVLQMLAIDAPLAQVLDVIARGVEALNPALRCNIVLQEDDGPEFCPDPQACLALPILSGPGKALGRFAVYPRRPGPAVPLDRQAIDDEVRLAALAIEKTAAQARLQLAASVFTHAREAIMITDAAGTIVDVNDTFTRITGYSRAETLGQNPRLLKSGRQAPEYYVAMWRQLVENGHWTGEAWNRRKNGEIFAEMQTISAVRDAAGRTQHYVSLFTDITPMKEHQKQLERIAHYDALTGLPNRVLLADRLQQAVVQSQRRHQSLAVAYLDLDGFKSVNDNHDHGIGDELLIAIAQRMKAALREGDTLARIGGDEFVAVLVDLERPQDCEPVLARLLQAAAAPIAVGAAVVQVSASIGVTLYPQDGADSEQLLRHADQAMYQAKQAGKNRYHLFDVDQDAAVRTQRENLERLRQALDRREFVLHYQPKVNMKTGAVIGAEALIRWQHPERGLLLPAAFLPIVENHPLGVELGEWVIDTALTQMAAWQAAGLDIPVSVNIGARQLQQQDFVMRLSELLAMHPDVQPSSLQLEVLETSALEDMVQVSELMRVCRALGVSFALDDFGTGYSSLTYLKRLPAAQLKIDRSFVHDMLDDPDDLAIVEGVMGLGVAFRRSVIAEGVESVAHGELLLPLGCELAQGYGIARPMPAADLPGWVATWRPAAAWTAWHERPLNRDDLTVVFAEVMHRHWLRAIETFLAGERDAPPPLHAHDCHFGHWQKSEGRARYGAHPEFPAVTALHDRVHALGRELVELHRQGQGHEAQARLGGLQVLRDQLIGRLRRLVPPARSAPGASA